MNHAVAVPNLAVVAGRPVTTSLNVAEVFGKQHFHVLRTIRDLDVPDEFRQSNFGCGSYLDDNNQPRSMYQITRDGFTLLAMGFTGKPAMRFKLAYIAAFNAMEARLPLLAEDQEVGLATGPAPITIGRLAEAAQGIKAAMIMARSLGHRDEQARVLANEIVLDLTGIDALELLGPSEEESRALALPLASDQPPAGWLDEKTLAEFVADACELNTEATVGSGELYRAFCQWLQERQGEAWPLPPLRQFNQTVSRHFRRHEAQVMRGGWSRDRFYLGLSLYGSEAQDSRLIDTVREFVADQCRCIPGERISATIIYRAFADWCAGKGTPTPSLKSFGTCLATLFDRRKSAGRVFYIGVAVAEEVQHG